MNSEQITINISASVRSYKKTNNKKYLPEKIIDPYVVNVPFCGRNIEFQSQNINENNCGFNTIFFSADISENKIREQTPDILKILLIDQTASTAKKIQNIIWANENYIKYGINAYAANSQIKPELITGRMGHLIKPRVLKSRELQKERTKSKAEVFTPTWMVKKQNDALEQDYLQDDLETYVKRKWLEITCGEAPYMATRYDMETGQVIPLLERVGFVDRKLQRINIEVNDKAEWQRLIEEAYKASYGFEWNGDSLLLARENLLYTYRDYYYFKWQNEPTEGLFKEIAKIISYNMFQMDGLKYIIPLTEQKEKIINPQMSFFTDEVPQEQWLIKPGKRVKIMNWDTRKMEFFDKGVK